MTTFNQQGQQVNQQYNSGGDMFFGHSPDLGKLLEQLQSVSSRLDALIDAGKIDAVSAGQVKEALQQSSEELKKPDKSKNKVIQLLKKGEELLKGVSSAAGIADHIGKLIHYIKTLV